MLYCFEVFTRQQVSAKHNIYLVVKRIEQSLLLLLDLLHLVLFARRSQPRQVYRPKPESPHQPAIFFKRTSHARVGWMVGGSVHLTGGSRISCHPVIHVTAPCHFAQVCSEQYSKLLNWSPVKMTLSVDFRNTTFIRISYCAHSLATKAAFLQIQFDIVIIFSGWNNP